MSDNTQSLQVFEFEGHETRVIMIDGDPWWVAADVCKVLGLDDVRRAVERLDDDERSSNPVIDRIGRSQNMYIVSEPGLYTLILGSRKPEAKRFRRWVTHEVLPSIRRTGSYSIHQVQPVETGTRPLSQADIIYLISHPQEIDEIRERLREDSLDLQLQSMYMRQQEKDLPALQRLLCPELVGCDPVEDERVERMFPHPETAIASRELSEPSAVSDRIQLEILRHLDRLSSRGKTSLSATGLRDYMTQYTRMQIDIECRNLVEQGILHVVHTSHTVKYERVGKGI